jgi:peptide methionine sulfoxide reductase MsrA
LDCLKDEGVSRRGAVMFLDCTIADDFWEAEPEHQDYLERYPNGYTCHFVRPQWKLRQQFLSSCSNSCQALVCLVGDV